MDVQHLVNTVFAVMDKATGPLTAIASAGHRVTGVFDQASHIVGTFGSIAAAAGGALSIHKMIEETTGFLGEVKKVQDYTGLAAQTAGGLLDVMANAGLEGEEATRIFARLSRAGAKMEMQMVGTNRAVGGTRAMYQRLGIDITKGPEKALFRVAELAKAGVTDAGDLQIMFGMQAESARKLHNALRKGPEEVRKTMMEFQKLGIATQKNVDLNSRMRAAQIRIKDTWENITVIIGTKLMPVMADFLETVANRLDEWLPKAAEFGEKLGSFLKDHHRTILAIGKVMLANFLLMKLTGAGIAGWLPKLLSFVPKLAVSFAGAAGVGGAGAAGAAGATGAAGAAAAAAAPILPIILAVVAAVAAIAAGFVAIRSNFEGVRTRITTLWERILAHFDGIKVSLAPVMRPLARLFSREGSVGRFFMLLLPRAIIGTLKYTEGFISVVQTIAKTVADIWDMAVRLWPDLVAAATSAWQAIVEGFDSWVVHPITDAWGFVAALFNDYVVKPITAAWGAIASFFSANLEQPILSTWKVIKETFMTYVGNPILTMWDKVREKLRPILQAVGAWSENAYTTAVEMAKAGEFNLGLLQPAADLIRKNWQEVQRETDAAIAKRRAERLASERERHRKEVIAARPPPPHYDFRGSRFDIKQMFAEGFDPDRIAVAFTNDLATLGERKVQSGLAPLFAVR